MAPEKRNRGCISETAPRRPLMRSFHSPQKAPGSLKRRTPKKFLVSADHFRPRHEMIFSGIIFPVMIITVIISPAMMFPVIIFPLMIHSGIIFLEMISSGIIFHNDIGRYRHGKNDIYEWNDNDTYHDNDKASLRNNDIKSIIFMIMIRIIIILFRMIMISQNEKKLSFYWKFYWKRWGSLPKIIRRTSRRGVSTILIWSCEDNICLFHWSIQSPSSERRTPIF